jgi:hypothetical protein
MDQRKLGAMTSRGGVLRLFLLVLSGLAAGSVGAMHLRVKAIGLGGAMYAVGFAALFLIPIVGIGLRRIDFRWSRYSFLTFWVLFVFWLIAPALPR